MPHLITKNSSNNNGLIMKGLSALILTSLLSGCFLDDDEPAPLEAKVNFVLASVDGGSCSLLDPYSNMTTIAGPSITTDSVAIFENVSADTGLAIVECSGGVYEDEATGASMTPGVLRSYVNITSSEFTATVSPLTEVAARLITRYELAHEDFASIAANVAHAVGLKDVDLATHTPLDTNKEDLNDSPSSHYGLVLAAISQLQADLEVDSAEKVIEELATAMANNGLFTSEEMRALYFHAIQNTFINPRIDRNEGDDVFLHQFFYGATSAPLASQVEYVHAEHPDDHDLEANYTINAFESAKFDIVGTHLSLHMSATLAGEKCRLSDLHPIVRTSIDTHHDLMVAVCPAQTIGETEFKVFDHDGRLENTTTISVIDPVTATVATNRYGNNNSNKDSLNRSTQAVATGSSSISGTVFGEAPLINAASGPEHNYNSASLEKFPIEGVTVQLLDPNNEVITSTVTTAGGNYSFTNAPDNSTVSIVVLAEIKKTRTTPNVGPEYNFTVRDNTSDTIPRKVHRVATPSFTTQTVMTKNIVAKVGFHDNGDVISDEARESAPFSILRSIQAAAVALEGLNANISLPTLDIYWSGRNIGGTWGDRHIGQIGTSHYAGNGTAPGLYILGRADVDTDEFDRGVIGHEFGHYLQDKLSFSDNPGDSHSDHEYKDASLAYGEGYGTAMGGLLAGSQHYCDVSGDNQTDGFCQDLGDKDLAGNVKGFYSESAIITLMYGIGNINGKGINAFFDAVTKMKSAMHSATIFSFLHHYLTANPDVADQVNALMAEHNIKSSDPFGEYPAGTTADPAIAAPANKGQSDTGATDLENLYLELPVIAVTKPTTTEAPVLMTPNAPTFCANRNLPGANSSNGLGMGHRFTFTSNFDGWILIKGEDRLGHILTYQGNSLSIRAEGGVNGSIFDYDGIDSADYFGVTQVEQGKKYSIKLVMNKPENILHGSDCGYKISLAATYD